MALNLLTLFPMGCVVCIDVHNLSLSCSMFIIYTFWEHIDEWIGHQPQDQKV